MFSHITAGSNLFAVTPGHSSSKTISLEKWSCIKNSLSLRISFSLLLCRLDCHAGRQRVDRCEKLFLFKITRKEASFASHSGTCTRARLFFRTLRVYFSLFFISLVLCLDARQETRCRVQVHKSGHYCSFCILGSIAVLIDMIEKDVILLNKLFLRNYKFYIFIIIF